MKAEIRAVYEEQLERLEAREDLDYLGALTENELTVLRLRLGLQDNRKHTLKEIGVALNLTKQRVGQIEKEAIRKILRAKRRDS
jgi:DNA-directed RNA polymerase sigma subunit (sigma70/sigma32)